jgi:hypothetical protein
LGRFEQEITEETESKSSVSSVHSLHSFQVGSWEDQPRSTIGQLEDIEINDQTQGDVEQLHVAEQLCLMDRVDCFDSFGFNEQALLGCRT